MADALGNNILVVIIPLYVYKLAQVDQSVPTSILTGILISSYDFIVAFFQASMGILINRFPRRKLFIKERIFVMHSPSLLAGV